MFVDAIKQKRKVASEIVNIVSDLIKYLEGFLHYDVEKVMGER